MYWKTVLFVEENKFNIFGSDDYIIVWRRKNEELNPKNLVGTVKHGFLAVSLYRNACQHQNKIILHLLMA